MSIATEFEYRCSVDSDIVGHLPYLFERASRAQTILELGVRSGNSTAAFLAGIEAGDGHLTSVDILAPQVPAEWFEHHRWTFILGSDLDEFVEAGTPDEVDLLFIDTTHTFRQTQAELDLYGGRVRSGGVILLHDVDLEQAPLSDDPEDRGYPVRRAANEWCRRKFLNYDERPGSYGLGVIEVV